MKGNDHAFSAMSALSLLLYFNSIFIIIYIESVLGLKLQYGEIILGMIFILIFTTNYFIFVYKGRHKKIEKKFKDESKTQKFISSTAIITLVIFTVFFGIFVLSK